ncbi:alpha/beta fold hydrolase [Pinirhizobacter soli]|uniref:alpha/beta fold hydrolase n=1 Tax=Pinirhizobacter soli TaxID=2786953 RepID=UPI00202A8575|nr:alpha/beta hydrolase [Pinirhizobacter soli]
MFITTEGTRHHVIVADVCGERTRVDPSTPVVVMSHGAVADSFASFYFSLHRPLAQIGFTNIMYDRRAHGRTPDAPGTLSLQQASADLAGILDSVGASAPVHLIGNSYGASVVVDFAVHYPNRAASIVLMEGSPPTREWRQYMLDSLVPALDEFDAERNRLLQIGNTTWYGRRAKAAIAMVDQTTLFRDTGASRVVDAGMLTQLTMPILGIYGGASQAGAMERAQHDLGHFSNFELEVIPDVGHLLLFDAAASVRRALTSFYRRHELRLDEHAS